MTESEAKQLTKEYLEKDHEMIKKLSESVVDAIMNSEFVKYNLQKVSDILAERAGKELAEARNTIYRYMIDKLSLNLEVMNNFMDKEMHKKFCNEKCLFKSMNLEKCKDGEEQCDIGAVLEEIVERVIEKTKEKTEEQNKKDE